MICAAALGLSVELSGQMGMPPSPPPPPHFSSLSASSFSVDEGRRGLDVPPSPDEVRRELYPYGRAPSPPPFWLDRGLPPFAPGAMPPVPGPVFSKAFNALLVLLVLGCVFLGLNLRDAVQKMQASDIGTNNELLTTGAGNAQWLASIQKSKGMRSGHHSACSAPVAAAKPKGKGSGKKGKVAARDDDDDAQELETFVKPKSKKKGKSRG